MSIGFLALSLRAIRQHRLSEHTGMLWLGVSLVMVFLSATLPFHLLDRAARFVGIAYPPDLILLIAVLFLFAFAFQLSIGQARLNEKNTKLAQEVGILATTPPRPPDGSAMPADEVSETPLEEPELLVGPDILEGDLQESLPEPVSAAMDTVLPDDFFEIVTSAVLPAEPTAAPEETEAVPDLEPAFGPDRPGFWSRAPRPGAAFFRSRESDPGGETDRVREFDGGQDIYQPVLGAALSTPAPRPRRALRWGTSFALLFLLIEAWSLATPLMASPDEPAHAIKAAAVVRGEFFGTPAHATKRGPSSEITVRVPENIAGLGAIPGCYATHPNVPASCAPTPGASTREVNIATTAGRYEPLYYAIVGLPSLLFPSNTGIWLMRLVSGLLSALFLASALESAAACKKRRLLVWGVAGAMTPMAVFMAGTINPNGLEASSAICLWASGIALLAEQSVVADRRLLARVGISAAVLVQVRGLSPLWLFLIAVSLVILAGRRQLVELSRDRVARIWAGVLALSCAFTAWWLVRYDPLALLPTNHAPPKHVGVSELIATSVGFSDGFVREMIGVVGWLDVPIPAVTYYGWIAIVFMLLGLGLFMGRRPYVVVLVSLVVLTVVIPIVFEATNASTLGYVWQGRYGLPLAAGIPLVAAGAVVNGYLTDRVHRRVATVIPVILVIAEFAIFFQALRRYTVGLKGTFIPFGGAWHPPFGTVTISVAFIVIVLAFALWLRLIVGSFPSPLSRFPGGESGGDGWDGEGGGDGEGEEPYLAERISDPVGVG
ncbi:MAG TPA: DUF2304 family protein [Acidimicrobiales bacterium]|nr:DUF2304 family protein [Acidimicrobiales bacterium]